MSGSDPADDDADSEKSVWDEIEEFAEADSADEEFQAADAEPQPDAEFGDETQAADTETPVATEIEADHQSVDAEPLPDTETVDEMEASDAETPADDESVAVDQLPDSEEAPDADEVFDEMSMSDVDGEALWDELANLEAEASPLEADQPTASDAVEGSVDAGSTGDPVGPSVERDDPTGEEVLVDKRVYCQQCPYFTDPPDVGCTHDGTAILEVLEDGRFRVSGCPVVTPTGPDRTILSDDH